MLLFLLYLKSCLVGVQHDVMRGRPGNVAEMLPVLYLCGFSPRLRRCSVRTRPVYLLDVLQLRPLGAEPASQTLVYLQSRHDLTRLPHAGPLHH